jgi:ribonuclease HI
MRLHSDASHDEDVIGIAYVIEDEYEDIYAEGKQYLHGKFTSMEAEYTAMMSGIHAASWRGNDTLVVCTDCEPLVDKMYFPDATNQKWFEYRQECHRILNTFDNWEMSNVPRSQNERADELAKQALYFGREDK